MKKTLLLLLAASSFWLGALSSCGGNTIGTACTADRDCDPGQSCFLNGFSGGFCSRGCTRAGVVGTECPSGTVCSAPSTGGGVLVCAQSCTDDAQCRTDYACRGTSGSDQKACVP